MIEVTLDRPISSHFAPVCYRKLLMLFATDSLKKVFTFVVLASSIFACFVLAPSQLHAQEDCDCIRMVPQTVYEATTDNRFANG